MMAKNVENFNLKGTIAAPGTAFKENGDINTAVIKEYVNFLIDNEIDGVFVLGTLGEGMSLTVEERKQVASAWVEHSKDRLSAVVVHIGTTNIRDSIELARHAESIKASAIACISPFFYRPGDEESLVDYLVEVASAAPNTPFYYYCINFITGVNLNSATVLELAMKRIPTLRGIKMSSRELPSMQDCTLACDGKLNVLVGTDEQFLTSLAINVQVPVINGYNGRLFKKLKAAFDNGDMETARKEQYKARKVIKLRTKYDEGPAMTKAIMKCHGLDLGPVRLPLKSIPDSKLDELKKDLQDCGLLL